YTRVVLHANTHVGGAGLHVAVEAEAFEQAAGDFRLEATGERGHFRAVREAAMRQIGRAVHAVEANRLYVVVDHELTPTSGQERICLVVVDGIAVERHYGAVRRIGDV